jgi:pimeloyl-ACP methyl ester carboxylesterase
MNAPLDATGFGRLEDLPLARTLLPNGVELHHVRSGSGPALIFVHGVMGDWRSAALQWPAFIQHFDCISYSRRYNHPNANHMASPDHSALVEAEDLRLFMDALGLAQAHVVASSYGAFAALALALQHPERVAAIVAAEPAMLCYAEFSEAGRAELARFRSAAIEPANAAFRAGDDALGALRMTSGIMGAAAPVASGPAMERRFQNARAMRMLALSTNEFPLLPPEQLAGLPMPVMLMSGADTEPIHAEVFRNVRAAMPQAQVAVLPKAGHAVARDQPALFNDLALDFLMGTRLPGAQ